MFPAGRAKRTSRQARRSLTAAVIAFVAHARLASAEPSASISPDNTLELSWEAPGSCGTAESVRRDVERVAGQSGEVQRKVRAHGEVRGTGSAWAIELTLVTDTGRSTRTLTASTCRALANATAVVIAFTMTSPESDVGPAPAAVEAPADGGAHVEPPPPARTHDQGSKRMPSLVRKAAPAPLPYVGPTVGLLARVDVGTLPSVAVGPGVLLGWQPGPLLLEASLGTLLDQDREIVPPTGRRATISHADFSALFARIALCPAAPGFSLARQSLRLLPCAGFGAVQTRVTSHARAPELAGTFGSDVARDATTDGWFGSIFVGPRLRFTKGWFAMSAQADVAVPFRRQAFVLSDRDAQALTVHQTGAVLAGLSFTVELLIFQ
ncbi:hypothetical protein AKJ09_01598 [Labilithrix luteola]|uniref:Uncharacterized protein n=1 Tax=Labilithrix luteola TaxID=1391654 RepID=A0A0K1PP86_9BACT|nr:hypothetical protein [Labilithrix luteola]AKU94934.1 hypothetical protein AKJ09_01598 [Labilithrix luteola]